MTATAAVVGVVGVKDEEVATAAMTTVRVFLVKLLRYYWEKQRSI